MLSRRYIRRAMRSPTKGDVKKLSRLVGKMITVPRTVVKYVWQVEQEHLHSFSASDIAECRRTAKSRSVGVLTLGKYYIAVTRPSSS